MKHDKHAQGRRPIALLKRRRHSGLELQMTGISLCWHKRVAECLEPGEALEKKPGWDGRLRYSVKRSARPDGLRIINEFE